MAIPVEWPPRPMYEEEDADEAPPVELTEAALQRLAADLEEDLAKLQEEEGQ